MKSKIDNSCCKFIQTLNIYNKINDMINCKKLCIKTVIDQDFYLINSKLNLE